MTDVVRSETSDLSSFAIVPFNQLVLPAFSALAFILFCFLRDCRPRAPSRAAVPRQNQIFISSSSALLCDVDANKY
jgi:hypothetical protein